MRVIKKIISSFLILIAQYYMGLRKYTKAVKLCLKARNISPNSNFVLFYLGNAYYFAGYYKEAKDTFLKVLSFKPDDIVTIYLMLNTLIKLNAFPKEIIPYMKLYLKNAQLHRIKFPYIMEGISNFMMKIFGKQLDLQHFEMQLDKHHTDFYLWAREVIANFEDSENKE